MSHMKKRVTGLMAALVFLTAGTAMGGEACISIDSVSYNGPEESRYLEKGVAQMVETRLEKAGVVVLDPCHHGTLAISVTLFGGTANVSADIEQRGYHFSRSGSEAELIGAVQQLADEVAGLVTEGVDPVPMPTKKAAVPSATPLMAEDALRSEVFPLEVQSVAVGDLTGDGVMEAVAVSHGSLQLLAVSKTGISETARVAIPRYLKPVRLEVLDFDGDGKQEVLLSALHAASQTPISMVYRHNGISLVPVGKEARFLTSVVTLPGKGRVCIGQKIDGIDYWGGVFQVTLSDQGLESAQPLEMDDAFKVMSWDTASAKQGGEQGLFTLSELGHLSYWRDAKTSVYRGDDNYGGSHLFLSKVEGSKKREERRYLVSRVQAVDSDDLKGVGVLQTKNALGSLFQGLRRYKSGRVVVVNWDGYDLTPVATTPSFTGFVSDFSIVDIDGDGRPEVFCSILNAKGGLSGKSRSYFALSSLE